MAKIQRYSMEFGKKEKVLNYACQTYQLSRPSEVPRSRAAGHLIL